jgi:hypothetical protein
MKINLADLIPIVPCGPNCAFARPSESGDRSARRPRFVPKAEFDERYDATYPGFVPTYLRKSGDNQPN